MTAPFSLPITYGTVSGSPIAGYANAGTWQLVYVTLSANYARKPPGDYPVPPYPGPVTASLTAFPQTIPNGTRLQLFADEAAALVTAGAAAYS
jgi:hypothetical protein